jgi:hypothetical protein
LTLLFRYSEDNNKAPYLSRYLTDNPYAKESKKLIESAENRLNEDKKILYFKIVSCIIDPFI